MMLQSRRYSLYTPREQELMDIDAQDEMISTYQDEIDQETLEFLEMLKQEMLKKIEEENNFE